MFLMKGIFVLFVSLSMGYVLCILARKQEGILKTLGYTLGISMIALSLVGNAVETGMKCGMERKSIGGSKSMQCPAGKNLTKWHHK